MNAMLTILIIRLDDRSSVSSCFQPVTYRNRLPSCILCLMQCHSVSCPLGRFPNIVTSATCSDVFTARCTSAQRGIEIACRPSVCLSVYLSVTLVDQDHIGWKSWKLIARSIRPTLGGWPLGSSQPKGHPRNPRRTWGNLGETIGVRWRAGEQKRQYL